MTVPTKGTYNWISVSSDGFIGGIQLTLFHDTDFSISLTDDALYTAYVTNENETKVIIVAPESNHLFSSIGNYEIIESIVANSNSELNMIEPKGFVLDKAYPNPFNPTTNLGVYIPFDGFVSIKVYDLMGREVSELHNGFLKQGYATYTWDASSHSSGVYIVKAVAGDTVKSQKVMLLK